MFPVLEDLRVVHPVHRVHRVHRVLKDRQVQPVLKVQLEVQLVPPE
jgi:hypothetical protein